MRVEIILRQSYGYPNEAAFVRSTKVQIFRCDRHISHRHGGIVLGFYPHLKQFGDGGSDFRAGGRGARGVID
jgi:hypothetical protein